MGDKRLQPGGSHRLAILLLAVALPPAATLVWLGWQLLLQDRALVAQRDVERRQAATQAVVRSLQGSLADAERHVLENPVPAGTVRLVFSPGRVRAEPAGRVAWVPAAAVPQTADGPFADAERLEFQGDLEQAARFYRLSAASPFPTIRAGALLRLARVRRRQGRAVDALQAYRDLARLDDNTVIDGTPATLLARRAACAVLGELGRGDERREEATRLAQELIAGRWTLDRPSWELTLADVAAWTGRPVAVSAEQQSFSAAGDAVWTELARGAHSALVARPPTTVLWKTRSDGTAVALLISRDTMRRWADRAAAATAAASKVALLATSGDVLTGVPLTIDAPVSKIVVSDSGLPWTVAVQAGSPASAAELSNQQRRLSAAVAAILLLLAGGSYFLWRVVQRELAIARLQADFVSAVSHEFRTPLTALRHVTELLSEGDDMTAERRAAFYEALARNTERLHRLVESLLDFGRIESGRRPYDMQPLEIEPAVAEVVADFRKVAPAGVSIDLDLQIPARVRVRADRSAIASALWNLLENAVKYSPERPCVYVSVRPHANGVAIAVRDEGIGIPAHEQQQVFGRFVRGDAATRLGIRGTGLGLAMVSHIVRAHRGAVDVASRENAGSTFTIRLPADV